MASLYKRRKKYWVSYVLDGRLVQKSLKTGDLRVARDKVRQIEYDLAVGNLHGVTRLPLPTILQAFCRHLMATRTYKSWKNDLSRLRVVFGPVCEALKPGTPGVRRRLGSPKATPDRYAGRHVQAKLLEDVTPQVLNRFITERIEQDSWKAKTANLTRLVLHRLFAYAIKHDGFVSRDRRYPNPAAGVERFKEPAPDIRFLDLAQIDQQLETVRDHPTIHAMVATYIYAGLRRGEAIWLTHEDVDLDKRLLRVRAKTVDGESWQPKTKRNRVVPISDALLAILTAYLPSHVCGWFFPSPTGKRWNEDNFSQDLAAINRQQGLRWTCLDYRHTFGSHLAQKGESLYKIAELMGNSPEICRKHYAALLPHEMREEVEFGTKRNARGSASGSDEPTQKLLQALLEKVERLEQQDSSHPGPHLRIAR